MTSLADISSNKTIKRPVIVAFLISSGVVGTIGPKLPRLLMKSIIRRRSSMSQKRKKIGGGPAQRRNKHRKQNKYLGVELFKDLDQV